MKVETKKNIAREVIILFSIGAIILISSLVIVAINSQRNGSISTLKKQKELLVLQRDSIIALPWNLPWLTKEDSLIWTPPKDAVVEPDLEYALKNSKENKEEIQKLVLEIEKLGDELSNLKPIDIDWNLTIVTIILFGFMYLLRPVFYLLKWAFKTIKE